MRGIMPTFAFRPDTTVCSLMTKLTAANEFYHNFSQILQINVFKVCIGDTKIKKFWFGILQQGWRNL